MEWLDAGDVAAIDTDDFARTGDSELQKIGGGGDDGAVLIEQLDFYVCHVVEGGAERCAVWDEVDFHDPGRSAEDVSGDLLAVVSGDGFERAGLIGDLPIDGTGILAGGFFPEECVVEEEFDLFSVALNFNVFVMRRGGIRCPVGKENLTLLPLDGFVTGIGGCCCGHPDAAECADHRLLTPPALALKAARLNDSGAI